MYSQKGFTLLEIMIVVTIMGVLAVIAIPKYQDYRIRINRSDAMTEMQNMGRQIESKKLAAGRDGYKKLSANNNAALSGILGDFPRSDTAYYTFTIENLSTGNWELIATPKADQMQKNDGVLTLRHDGYKCRKPSGGNKCGTSDEWRN